MNNSPAQKIVAFTVLIVAVGMIVAGCIVTHKAYDKDDSLAEFGVMTFTRLHEWQLIEDTTFTGVERRGDKLYSTYDRAKPRGKKACPT